MVWHIFRKDWTLLWPLALALIAAQLALAAGLYMLGPVGGPSDLGQLVYPLSNFFPFGVAFILALAVQQDAPPSVRQDWLMRPIRRRDLLLAKLLFTLVVVQAPMLVADIGEGLLDGFPLGESIAGAVSRNLYVLVDLSPPVIALAALTKNIVEFIVAGIAYLVAMIAATMLLNGPILNGGVALATNPIAWTGVAWIPNTLKILILLIAAVAIVLMQYFYRKTRQAKLIFAGAAFISVLTILLPWRLMFAVEQGLSPVPGAGQAISVTFNPGMGRFRPAPGQDVDEYGSYVSGVGAAQVLLRGRNGGDIDVENQRRRAEGATTIFIPLRVAGLLPEFMLRADRADINLIGPEGNTVYHRLGNDMEARNTGSGEGATAYQGIRIPAKLYDRVKDQPLRLEVNYSLTLFHRSPPEAIQALGGKKLMPGMGQCQTRSQPLRSWAGLYCLTPGQHPTCLSGLLENSQNLRRNADFSLCAPDYSPYFAQLRPDGMSHFWLNFPFRDEKGDLAVDGSQLSQSRMVIWVNQARDHFTRTLTIPEIRLADWTIDAPERTPTD